jgi:acyl transferase domain-containing protein
LALSAKTESALETVTRELATNLNGLELADVAYTLAVGRDGHECRRVVICHDAAEAESVLATKTAQHLFSGAAQNPDGPVTFMFPGQAAQYPQMGRGLYDTEASYRQVVDECAELLQPHLGLDLRSVLYPATDSNVQADEQLRQTGLTQPAMFVTEYALARLLMSWGLTPNAMIGHSLGEYVAACLSGVLSLADALRLIAERGRLMQKLPSGSMLAVPLSEERVRQLLGDQLDLAAINAPSLCVVSGPTDAVDELERDLAAQGLECRRLRTSHAFHSAMMDPMLPSFTELMRSIKLLPPAIPYISNVSGTWITSAEATDVNYWARHIRHSVRFGDGVRELLRDAERLLLEVGPGQTLNTLAKVQTAGGSRQVILSSMRHAQEQQSDQFVLLRSLGRLWVSGARVNWSNFYDGQRRQRLPLPTYPFERQRYWIEPGKHFQERRAGHRPAATKLASIDDWFYTPSWKRSTLPVRAPDITERKLWLVFVDDAGVGASLVSRLRDLGQDVITVERGQEFVKISDSVYQLAGRKADEYKSLLDQVSKAGQAVQRILHLWCLNSNEGFESAQLAGYYSLLHLAQSVSAQPGLRIDVVTNSVQEVNGAEELHPEQATILGACKVIEQELANITCRSIDVESGNDQRLTEQLFREVTASNRDAFVAYRGSHRWVRTFEAFHPEPDPKRSTLRKQGVYLITGGMGNIGFALAEHLARNVEARLVLVSRNELPAREEWDQWLATHDEVDVVSRRIARVRELEEVGAQVLCEAADVGNEQQMRAVVQRAEARFGEINGVVHAAGVLTEEAFKPISRMVGAESEWHFQAKAHGTLVLEKILHNHQLDFCVLFSSLSTVLGGLGYAAYAAANSFLDAFAARQNKLNGVRWISIDWDGWLFNGRSEGVSLAITPDEGIEAFQRIIFADSVPQIIVSTGDLQARLDLWRKEDAPQTNGHKPATAAVLYPRPALQNEYVEPRNDIDRTIVNIWRESLGVDQVGIHDNFFDLGGHSLLATQVIAELNKKFPVGFSIADLFERSTVFALSNMVLQEKDNKPSFAESTSRGQMRRERQQRRMALQEGSLES